MSGLGISVNYDVANTVDKMMQQQMQYQRLHQMQATLKVQQLQTDAYTSLQTLFATMQTSFTNLTNTFNTVALQAIPSNLLVVSSATATSNDVGMSNHTVVVSQLAQAQQYMSLNQFASENTSFGVSETLMFTNSATPPGTFSVPINGTDTLENIRDNINNAQGNIGVSASIVSSTGTGGATVYNLILNSQSGTVNQVTITGDSSNLFNFSQTVQALDAKFTFDGLNEVTSNNTINNVLDGLEFTLSGVGTSVINVSPNNVNMIANVNTNIQEMLNAYNAIIQFLDADQVVSYKDKVNNVSSSAYNSSFSLIKMQLQQAVNTLVSTTGDISQLSGLGILLSPPQEINDQYDVGRVYNSYGSLMIDPTLQPLKNNMTTLQWVLNNDFNSLKNFFTDPKSGFITNVNNYISTSIITDTGTGAISSSLDNLSSLQEYTNEQINNESQRLMDVRENLIEKYTQLNVTIAMYQSISEYLEKQYDYLGGQLNKK
jgi:flagellar hook-associated protein 2